ncbi:MAG: GAF domain-containing protein [Chlorogloeopsis fritschii C42_A2020_084]|uniref:GAF domain-containing protein n=1 Tax=Chlorogloeopsis fritschii TaxID=1124 RepID=UPI001A049C80|nr:GAF domain-containing protein [Chlorogloeopsis fritschii]MBF2006331.1 GAF domain-containing protein [Chlorogloeopsis fritschii C42_A2020_084]
MFWADHIGLQRFYKGWKVRIGRKPTDIKAQLAQSLQKELQWVQEYMSVDTVTFLLPVEGQQNLSVYATIGLEEEISQQIRVPIGQGFAGHIAASMKPMVVDNLSKVEVVSPVLRHKDLKSLVGIPIPIKQGMIGVLHVGTYQSHNFTEHDVHQLQLVAHRIRWMIKDAGIFNFECSSHNQEGCFDVFGLNVRLLFALNYHTLKAQVLRLASFAQSCNGSKQGKVQFAHP